VYYLTKANFLVEENLNQAFSIEENLNKELQVREEELTANIEHLSCLTKKIDTEKAKLSAIVESPNHLIWSIDTDYKLIYCNSIYSSSFHKRFGKQLQSGDIILNLLDESSVKWKEWYDKALSGSKFSVEHTGNTSTWEIFFNPIMEENNMIVGATMFMQNISVRKEAQQQLIKAKELAEQASLAKAQFLSTMSHEIRTPMNAVIGMTHLLLEEAPRPDQEENLRILSFAAKNLLALINDILDFSKIDAGKIEFEEIEFNLKDLIQSICKTLHHKADEKGLKMELLLDNNIPSFLIGDPVRLNQIITNLLSNAIKFTHTGHITTTVTLKEILHGKATIDFAVKDTGIGIPADKIDKIFDSFTQASSETTRKYGGTGLGLAITKKLLELQNSHIYVNSKVGEGCIFYFSLSFKTSYRKEQPRPEVVYLHQAQLLQGVKILLVEDNRVNQLIISKFLLKWGLQVDMADNGLIAVDLLKTAIYDLILMDLEMPEMDGYEATRTIRSFTDERYKEIPIIALTASAMIEVQDQVFASGMNGYVTKPFDPDELYQVLAKSILRRLV
jgi:signal transduction histidine kinase/ActR/RegA family two-component response regulator